MNPRVVAHLRSLVRQHRSVSRALRSLHEVLPSDQRNKVALIAVGRIPGSPLSCDRGHHQFVQPLVRDLACSFHVPACNRTGLLQNDAERFSCIIADFKILGPVRNVEVIAAGRGVRSAARLRRLYGSGRWGKMKGEATIEEADTTIREAEVHWYEAHGIGRRGWKIKRYLD